MSTRFWEWIATVNARLVFLWTSLICLGVLSSGILLSGRGAPAIEPLLILGDPRDAVALKRPGSGASTPTPPADEVVARDDPFGSKFLVSLLEREQRRKEAQRRREEAKQFATPAEPDPPAESPTVVRPPRLAQLLYRGMFTRPDGTVLALVENQTTGETAFVREQDRVEGLVVGPITRASLSLGDPRKELIVLTTGEPTPVELVP
jgi:hypothetical protein